MFSVLFVMRPVELSVVTKNEKDKIFTSLKNLKDFFCRSKGFHN